MKLAKFGTKVLANAGVTMFLNDLKTGKATTAGLVLLGKDSDEFRTCREERERFFADRVAAGKSVDISQEERDELACNMLARCTKAFIELEDDNGSPLSYSLSGAERLYLDYPAIREQANIFIAERANFAPA